MTPEVRGIDVSDDDLRPSTHADDRARLVACRDGEETPALLDLARIHEFPAIDPGGPRKPTGGVAILVFGGSFVPDDLDATMRAFNLPTPTIEEVGVLGERNPGRERASFETTMDVCVVASLISTVPITLFFAPRSSRGLLHALEAAIWHPANPSVISISYGNAEKEFPQQTIDAVNRLLQLAGDRGITVCCSTGDAGTRTRVPDGRPQVEFPASSPWVLSCGGCVVSGPDTSPSATALNRNGVLSGGGVSRVHLLPQWQDRAARSWEMHQEGVLVTRGVPDVCAHAIGFQFVMSDTWLTGEGTSIAAPAWAALIARCNYLLDARLGFINPRLYSDAFQGAFVDITSGDNGRFKACPGWDACTGLGMPRGVELLRAFRRDLSSRANETVDQ